jgi:hypothetical protein
MEELFSFFVLGIQESPRLPLAFEFQKKKTILKLKHSLHPRNHKYLPQSRDR